MLRLPGEIDFFTIDAVRDEIHAAVLRDGPDVIELDCSELTYIHREGIGMLFGLRELFLRSVVLTGMNEDCRQRIRLMGLEGAFAFHA